MSKSRCAPAELHASFPPGAEQLPEVTKHSACAGLTLAKIACNDIIKIVNAVVGTYYTVQVYKHPTKRILTYRLLGIAASLKHINTTAS